MKEYNALTVSEKTQLMESVKNDYEKSLWYRPELIIKTPKVRYGRTGENNIAKLKSEAEVKACLIGATITDVVLTDTENGVQIDVIYIKLKNGIETCISAFNEEETIKCDAIKIN
jgi:hypothetical protein